MGDETTFPLTAIVGIALFILLAAFLIMVVSRAGGAGVP